MVWMKNADRLLTKEEMVWWVDKPQSSLSSVCERQILGFWNKVVNKLLNRTKTPNGKCFQTVQHLIEIEEMEPGRNDFKARTSLSG